MNTLLIVAIIIVAIIGGVVMFIESITPVTVITSDRNEPIVESVSLVECSGTARCISGKVTNITDGDTINIDEKPVRFALASAPEKYESDGQKATKFIEEICPLGSVATVDEDDGQTQGSYGRILGVVYCNGYNLNSELLDSGLGYILEEFCDTSEFGKSDWIQKHGCKKQYAPITTPQVTIENKPKEFSEQRSENNEPKDSIKSEVSCSQYYPDVCISPYPPDLDCGDIHHKRFKVLQPDPHRFDGDKDGIGCEA